LPDHDEALSGDILTTLNINFEWRRLISDALQSYADSIIRNLDDSLVDDFRNQFQALINDLYTVDTVLSERLFVSLERTTDQTITGGVPDTIDWDQVHGISAVEMWNSLVPDRIIIPEFETGFYQMSGAVWFPSSGAAHNRIVKITVNGTVVYNVTVTTAQQQSVTFAYGQLLFGDDIVRLQIESPTTIAVQGNTDGITTFSIVRIPHEI
jgi:hypothetical protein